VSASSAHGSAYEFKSFKYSSHSSILKFLDVEREPCKILDVGTAGGYLGKILSARGHSVFGIEKDAETAQKAKHNYQSFQIADIETFEFLYYQEFDYILFADVLEHLRDPEAVLQRCIPALKESGKIVISVPNIANFIIRLSLLAGKFDYVERGILDKTHLRFFTLRGLEKMIGEVRCRILSVTPTPLPLQIVLPLTEIKFFAPLHEALYILARCWKTMFAYQFVIVIAPNSSSIQPERSVETADGRVLANARVPE
jgi:SAM-dependent methyltransferase